MPHWLSASFESPSSTSRRPLRVVHLVSSTSRRPLRSIIIILDNNNSCRISLHPRMIPAYCVYFRPTATRLLASCVVRRHFVIEDLLLLLLLHLPFWRYARIQKIPIRGFIYESLKYFSNLLSNVHLHPPSHTRRPAYSPTRSTENIPPLPLYTPPPHHFPYIHSRSPRRNKLDLLTPTPTPTPSRASLTFRRAEPKYIGMRIITKQGAWIRLNEIVDGKSRTDCVEMKRKTNAE